MPGVCLMTAWWLPDDCVMTDWWPGWWPPEDCLITLITAWCLLDDCLMTDWWPGWWPGWWPPEDCLMTLITAWSLPDDFLVTYWWLLPKKPNHPLRCWMTKKSNQPIFLFQISGTPPSFSPSTFFCTSQNSWIAKCESFQRVWGLPHLPPYPYSFLPH